MKNYRYAANKNKPDIAFDIFVIILGAIFFLKILNSFKIIESLSFYLGSISGDYRVQIIILAWFFENFIEGTAGFGTPSAVVAPLLIGLGLSPLTGVIISLLGNSTSVAFGAAGTPIRIGFADIAGSQVPFYAAVYNLVGFLVPVFMLWVMTKGKEEGKRDFKEALPFAVFSGFAFVIPSLLLVPLGQEFPSILGSIVGLILVLIAIKIKFLVPKEVRSLRKLEKPENLMPLPRVIFPYAVLIILLLLGKFLLGSLGFTIALIGHKINFFNPGLAFLLAGVVTLIGKKDSFSEAGKSLASAFKGAFQPFLVILAMSGMVQLLLFSGQNTSGFAPALNVLSEGLKTQFLPLIAPFLGAFGSFLTGSATVSNIMFGNVLKTAAEALGLNVQKILALALVGGAAGNMIALADILTAEAVVGLQNKTREVLKGVFVPCIIYLVLVSLMGLFVF